MADEIRFIGLQTLFKPVRYRRLKRTAPVYVVMLKKREQASLHMDIKAFYKSVEHAELRGRFIIREPAAPSSEG